jgi:hypothetical protein
LSEGSIYNVHHGKQAMEADLGRRLSEEDLKDEAQIRALEPELLNRLTVDIFDGTGSKAAKESDTGAGASSGGGGVAQGEARTEEGGAGADRGRTGSGGGEGIGTAPGKARTKVGGAEANRGGGVGGIVAEVTFADFRLLYADGNDKYASAQRGDNYYIFNFVTS